MARGITEAQVHAAADALVAAGERPTVERIRAHLGSGSPNTVTRLLDSWWAGLGPRLAALAPRVTLPEAPDTVQRLAGELWAQAVASARETAETALANERDVLAQARAALAAEQADGAAAIAAATQARQAADQARELAEARLAEAQRRADQLEAQLVDVTEQRGVMATRAETLERERAGLAEQLQSERTTAAQEREAQAAHVRAVEDRGHAEVDRARQEAQDLRAQLQALARDHGREQATSRQALQQAQTQLSALQQALATQSGRADTLERQLTASQAKLQPAARAGRARATPRVRRGTPAPETGATRAPPRAARSRKSP